MKTLAIVTGASSGMGVEFARQIALEGVHLQLKKRKNKKEDCVKEWADEIWILARRKDKLEETKSIIEKNLEDFKNKEGKNKKISFPSVKCLSLDLAGKDGALSVKNAILEEEEKTGKGNLEINILVNNAGFGTYGEFINTDAEREMNMVELNCTSLTGITGFCLPFMKKGSRIINTASLASFMPLGNFAVYGASKAYVLSFSVAIKEELKPRGIKVTALCPGPVSTEFAEVASKGARKEVRHGLSPVKTVNHCLKSSRKGKMYSMRFFKWRFKARASTFVKRELGAWFTFKFNKRPSN